jgi:hypothetical protein
MTTVIKCPLFKLESVSKSSGDFNTVMAGTNYGDYLYWSGSIWSTDSNKVHLGANAGRYYQGQYGIAIGQYAGTNYQSTNAIAIGLNSGNWYQGLNSIAIGENSGLNLQGQQSIAIGQNSGNDTQGDQSIAIGTNSGIWYQGNQSIAIGLNSGSTNQGSNSISIGSNVGINNQGQNAIAIGQNVGINSQGSNTIAIGQNAGAFGQPSNSIILNASSTVTLNGTSEGFFVNPIRGPTISSNVLSYNTATKEIIFNGSSRRYKHDIKTLTNDTKNVYKLEPKEFKYNIGDKQDIGLIAEEADECDPWFAYKDKDGIPEGIQWNSITTYLISEMKKMKEDIDIFELEIHNFKQKQKIIQ